MTEVAGHQSDGLKQDSLVPALSKAFALSPHRLDLLTKAIRADRVTLPTSELRLTMGVSMSRIEVFRRDIAYFGPQGEVRLGERLAIAVARADEKLSTILRQQIESAPERFKTADQELAAAMALWAAREAALKQWLNSCGLGPAALQTLVSSLRYNATYLHYMGPPIGALYVELN